MRRLMLWGSLLLAVTGCATTVGAPMARPMGQDAAFGARAVPAAMVAGSAEDRAAELAGETSDTWTPPASLGGYLPPEYLGADAAAAASKAVEFPTIKLDRFAKVDEPLYRGSLPKEADLRSLKALGIKTDITLMGEVPVFDTFHVAREKRWAKKVGLKFVQVKVPTGKVPLAGKVSDAVATAFLKVVLDPANQPVYFHCLHGRDRTGTMAAVYRIARNGYSNAQAFEEMKSFGFNEKDYPTLAAFVKSYKPAAR